MKSISSSTMQQRVDPVGALLIYEQMRAAEESEVTGIYVTWVPRPACDLKTSLVADELKSGQGQCSRLYSESVCHCGHNLASHKAIKIIKGYIRPPCCGACRCKEFSYVPVRPEECGQSWLSHRKGFDILQWQQRIRRLPHDYACIGCEQLVSDHETVIESAAQRIARGAAVGITYAPLFDHPELSARVRTVVAAASRHGGGVTTTASSASPHAPPVSLLRHEVEDPAVLIKSPKT